MKNTITFFLLLLLAAACNLPVTPASSGQTEIGTIFLDYNQETTEVFLQVQIMPPESADRMDSVRVVLYTLPDQEPAAAFSLKDDGTQGDLLPGNGIFSILAATDPPLAFGAYLIESTAYSSEGTVLTQTTTTVIAEEFPPVIASVDMPEIYSLDPDTWTDLNITVKIDDPNGADDIKYVRYYINTDFLTVDCEGNYNDNPQDDNYQSDPTWQMEYSHTDNEGLLVYTTSIPMRPVDDGSGGCGKTGIALFRFLVKDKSNRQDTVSEIVLEIVSCGDGECQAGAEDAETCPEDC
ncbi:MAG: hypothetical protein GXO91_07450 [FCB group bacterium]|nr:hypothetical protein [FCB group bacterium]